MLLGTFSLAIGLLLLALALGLWLWSRNLEEEADLPEGNVIYTDAGSAWFSNNDALVSAQPVRIRYFVIRVCRDV